MKNIIPICLLVMSFNVQSEEHRQKHDHNHKNYFSYAMKFGKVNGERLSLHEFHAGWLIGNKNYIGIALIGNDDRIHSTNNKLGYVSLVCVFNINLGYYLQLAALKTIQQPTRLLINY